jgi:colicin import membrane protein
MAAPRKQTYFIGSVIVHVLILLGFVLGFDFSSPLPVIENTNKNDVISAVVLGDSAKSKILPQELPSLISPVLKEEPKPQPIQQASKDVIAIKAADKKKLAKQKALEAKKQRELLTRDLLADIKKHNNKQKKITQKKLKSRFDKRLHEQAEKSLRQQLLKEEIKLQGTQTRQSRGEVNKYKALILQAISERWVIPPGVNKSLSCELRIRLAPSGEVLDVQVTRSSGDPSLDHSARTAVLKASPLPVPSDLNAFEAFREFALKVKPENILAKGGELNGGV